MEEAEEPSLTRGPTAQSPILCSSMWKMAGEQEGGGWCRGKRRRGAQLVGSANRSSDSHLIDM